MSGDGNGTWNGEDRRRTTGRNEQIINIRSLVVLILSGGWALAFVSVLWTSKIIVDVGAFAAVLGVAMTWLFKSNDAVQQAKEVKEAVQAAKTPAPPAPPAAPSTP